MPQVEVVNLSEYSRGVDEMVKAVADGQCSVPLDDTTRQTINVQSIAGTFGYVELCVLYALAIDRLAMQQVEARNNHGVWKLVPQEDSEVKK